MMITCFNCENTFIADVRPKEPEFDGYVFSTIGVRADVEVEKVKNIILVKCPHCGKSMSGEVEY